MIREIDGGKEVLTCDLPMIAAGQKGMVEEEDLRIPNMRGIMMARKKPLKVVAPTDAGESTSTAKYEKPLAKGACKMVDANNIDALIKLLHDEAKVI
jgi:electron transfer flavoprotein beta subunit